MKRKNTLFLAGLLCVMGTLSCSAAWAATSQAPKEFNEAILNFIDSK